MSQDNSFNPPWDPDKTHPAGWIDEEAIITVMSPVNPKENCESLHPATAAGSMDDDATWVIGSDDEDHTRLVAQLSAPEAPAHLAVTRSDIGLQAEESDPDSGSLSPSWSLSHSQTAFSSFAPRGPSQLRRLAEEAATGQAAPASRYDRPESSTALPPGFGLFEYRIERVLGRGSFGITYLATDMNLNIQVAIKEYMPSHCANRASDYSVVVRWQGAETFYLDGLEAFLIEARTLATFQHPNIVGVARFFEAYRTAYIVQDYEEGQSLKQWWVWSRKSRESWLVELLQPLLDGLALVHESGYMHRDIKPDNIYASVDDDRLVLLDFGAARLSVGGELTVADALTPGYAPAEQYDGGLQGPWTDIYAVGATLYWMVTGKKPESAPARMTGEVKMLPAVEAGAGRYSASFLKAIDWALQPDAQARPQNVREFTAALFAEHAGTLGLQDALRSADTRRNQAARKQVTLGRKAALFLGVLVHPNGWRMTVKMTVMMVMALVPILMMSYYNLQGSIAYIRTTELTSLEDLADSTAGRVSQLIDDNRALAAYLASDVRFTDYLNEPTRIKGEVLQTSLINLTASNSALQLAFLLDRDGNALISSDPELIGENYGFRQYFKEAVNGNAFTTGLVLGTTTGTPGMFFSHPVRAIDGSIIGVAVIRLNGSFIKALLDEVRESDQAQTPMMFDADGVLVDHPDESKLYSSLNELPADTMDQLIKDKRFNRSEIDNLQMPALASVLIGATKPGSLGFHSNLSGVDEFVGFAPVKGSGLVVAVSESESVFEAPLQQFFKNILYSLIGAAIFLLVMAIGLARSVVHPVRRLTVAADALKRGDFDNARIKVSPHRYIDEIGQLSRTFNIMIDVLRQRERQRAKAKARRHGEPRKTETR